MENVHATGAESRRSYDQVPHTEVHLLARRSLETLQDIVVILLMVLLLCISLQALWRLVRMAAFEAAPPTDMLSQILFVLILTELYRLLIFYLREHRVSVALAIEVALVGALRATTILGVHEFNLPRLAGLSLLLLVLGGLLAMERWMRFRQHEVTETDAR